MAVAQVTGEAHVVRLKRRLLAWAALSLVGIAWCVAVDQASGGWLVVIAFVMLVATVHRFGRTGPG